jgi:hypothetical protein
MGASWKVSPKPMSALLDVRRHAFASLIPPPRLRLSDWIEQNIRLPEGVSALSCASPSRADPGRGAAERAANV